MERLTDTTAAAETTRATRSAGPAGPHGAVEALPTDAPADHDALGDALASGALAGYRQEPPSPEAAAVDAPALEGPFVAVAPGVWVRAGRVSAVARAAHGAGDEGDPGARTGSRVYVLGVEPTSPAPGFASPHPVDALVTALRMAEHREEVRRLKLCLRLVAPLLGAPARRR